MIELSNNALMFTFPEVHPEAKLTINFQRTLRIPDDGKNYPLPPGLGRFPLQHVDDFANQVPESWIEHGGVMLPMYQSEALWISFGNNYINERETEYPFAIKIATGKINAVTGDSWTESLSARPQDYVTSPRQPWLDGYCVEKGFIRQFVAMPLGTGYSAEEQITGKAQYGGIQLVVYPMKREIFESRFPKIFRKTELVFMAKFAVRMPAPCPDMGLAPGGRMRQEIYDDPFNLSDWDLENNSRCFIHIANSMVWRAITGKIPPTVPFTANEYNKAGLPWFEYYDDNATAVSGSEKLNQLKSVTELGNTKGEVPLPENESMVAKKIIQLRSGLKKLQVREGNF